MAPQCTFYAIYCDSFNFKVPIVLMTTYNITTLIMIYLYIYICFVYQQIYIYIYMYVDKPPYSRITFEMLFFMVLTCTSILYMQISYKQIDLYTNTLYKHVLTPNQLHCIVICLYDEPYIYMTERISVHRTSIYKNDLQLLN